MGLTPFTPLLPLMAPMVVGADPQGVCDPTERARLTAVYQGQQYSDAFSSVAYFGNGVIVAGKRSWNDYSPNRAIWRSTDYGRSWADVPNQAGITGSHVYFFGQNGSRVFAGTGDTGNACLMRSDDWGATWSVVLGTAQLRALAGTTSDAGVAAVFSPVYVGGNRWLVTLRNDETSIYLLESTDNGQTWHAFAASGIGAWARKMIRTSDGVFLYAGISPQLGMYVSYDGGYSFSRNGTFSAFSGMTDLGNGIYLAGTWSQGSPPVSLSLYKSSDRGATWTRKKTVSVATGTGYFRTLVKVTSDLVIAYASCSEFSWSDRCAETYVSQDSGETWTNLGMAYVGPYGNMNAVYDTALVADGTFVAGAQPDSNILRNSIPPCMVWVDFAYIGPEKGLFDQPYNTLAEAVVAVPTGGTVSIKPGSGRETASINKAMTIQAPNGVVTIGQ